MFKMATVRAIVSAVFLIAATGSAAALCEEHKFGSDEWWQCISSTGGASGN